MSKIWKFYQRSGTTHTIATLTQAAIDGIVGLAAGDTVEVTNTTQNAVTLSNIDFEIPILIKPATACTIDVTTYSGQPFRLTDCNGVILENWTLRKGLYSIYTTNCSNIMIRGCDLRDVGQEMITFGIDQDVLCENLVVYNCYLDGSGKSNAQYGEMVYVGSGSDAGLGRMTDVVIWDNEFTDFTNECIDIKSNCTHAEVIGNYIHDGVCEFNAAVSFSLDVYAFKRPSNYVAKKNTITNVAKSAGSLVSYIAVGGGNCLIEGNVMTTSTPDDGPAIRTYSDFSNRETRTVIDINNTSNNFHSYMDRRPNYGGTGGMNCNYRMIK